MLTKIRSRREELGINQTELARLCDVSRQTIYAVEVGTFRPSVVLALKIAAALKESVEDLFILEKGD